MSRLTQLMGDVSRKLGWAALTGGLLAGTSIPANAQSHAVEFSSGFSSPPVVERDCPQVDCPPNWSPGTASPPAMRPKPRPSAPQSGRQPAGPVWSLPQANPQSPVPAPFTGDTQPTQANVTQAGFSSAGLTAAVAPTSVTPNMIGDFFGAITSEPLILPGNLVNQAIYFQPTPIPGGQSMVDYYRVVTEIDPMTNPGAFQTVPLVYVASQGGQIISANPSLVPPQLLDEYVDTNGFAGDPVFLTGGPDPDDPLVIIPPAPQNPGTFLALTANQTADTVDVTTAEGPATLIDEQLFNIYEALLVYVPTPGSGGGVGRQKIAENTSPIPRDRVFINHSTFTGVPFTTDGVSVYRFAPGIERSFYQQRASLEVRFPFASTIDAHVDANQGVEPSSTQFGNIVTTLKYLVRQTSHSATAIGVSVTAPTAKDLNVDVSGTPYLSIENESVHVMPYIGGVHNQGRWFGQWYVQGDVDSTGSPVDIRNVYTGVIEGAGTLSDAPMLYASISGGFWVFQNGQRSVSFDSSRRGTVKRTVYSGTGGVTGLAPIMEFHFNRSLDKGEVISSGPIVFQSASDFSTSNVVLGGMMTFGTGGSLTVAWGTPVLGQDDKQFDNEIRVLLDYEY